MKTIVFTNHHPLNIASADVEAAATRDGGDYQGAWENTYQILRGQRLHLVHFYATGDKGYRDSSEYLHRCETTEEMVAWLLEQPPSWWTSTLLLKMGWEGETA